MIEGVRGFGHSFPEEYTSWEKEVQGSETHQRIVQYHLGKLKCLVRFECDGYIKNDALEKGSFTSSNTIIDTLIRSMDDDEVLSTLQGTTLSQSINEVGASTEDLVMKHGGSEIPQGCIFDLKTRSGKHGKEIEMSDIYPLLWIKQIPNFIIAYHDGAGLFKDIRVQDVKKELQTWEKNNMVAISHLSTLLEKIIDIAKNNERGLLEAYFSGEGGLEIRSQFGEGTHALPAKLAGKWMSDEALLDFAGSDASDEGGYWLNHKYDSDVAWNADSDDEEPDYTACSADDCGYCGKCTY